jgi:hypothetical protein
MLSFSVFAVGINAFSTLLEVSVMNFFTQPEVAVNVPGKEGERWKGRGVNQENALMTEENLHDNCGFVIATFVEPSICGVAELWSDD